MNSFPEHSAEETVLWGCLASQHGLGHAGVQTLARAFGSVRAVYEAAPAELKAAYPRLQPQTLASLSGGPKPKAWEALTRTCEKLGIRVTAPGWPGYPAPLLDLEAPPPLLFVKGAWLPEDGRAVALVGTRAPTAYGRQAAHVLARDLAGAGFTIVSGLALGIDAAAHAGALAAGGRTVAVIGCGLDIAYPRENLGLRERLEQSGAVISEFPPGTEPHPGNFPRRNRLISALSRATVVVEAGERSGALLTAAHARNQGRTLFAVPGPIFSPVSSGAHALLRKGAVLACSSGDVLAVLDGVPHPARTGVSVEPPASSSAAKAPRKTAAATEKKKTPGDAFSDPVLRLWAGDEVCGLDLLANRACESKLWTRESASAALLESLLQLELRGWVQRLPGPAYRLLSSGRLLPSATPPAA